LSSPAAQAVATLAQEFGGGCTRSDASELSFLFGIMALMGVTTWRKLRR
jgi:hypothetical protein